MRKTTVACLFIILLFYISAFAQEKYKKSNVSSGKETIKFDGTSKVVAKNSVVSTIGNVTSIESFKANVSRRVALAEAQIEKIKTNQKLAEEKIKQLKDSLYLEQKARKELAGKIKELKDKLDSIKDQELGKDQ